MIVVLTKKEFLDFSAVVVAGVLSNPAIDTQVLSSEYRRDIIRGVIIDVENVLEEFEPEKMKEVWNKG